MTAPAYTTPAVIKTRLGTQGFPTDDATLASIVLTASRQIDRLCGRRFYQEPGVTKVLTADSSGVLDVPDLVSVDAIATDISGLRLYDNVWSTSDFDLNPFEAVELGYPYTSIQPRPFRSQWFPTIRRGVQITGTWGWPAVPDEIAEATVLQSIRLLKRKDSPYGVAGQGDFGVTMLSRFDPDVLALCGPYQRLTIGAV